MTQQDISKVLQAIDAGDPNAAGHLFTLVYSELHRLATARIARETPGHTLQPTALVHEVFLKLVSQESGHWNNTGHFFAAAAQAMRRILVDNARRKKRIKRGGEAVRVDVDIDQVAASFDDERLLDLEEALEALAELDPVKAQLVELRYFGGLSVEQACDVLGISRATAHRYWTYSRAWLFQRISKMNPDQDSTSLPDEIQPESSD